MNSKKILHSDTHKIRSNPSETMTKAYSYGKGARNTWPENAWNHRWGAGLATTQKGFQRAAFMESLIGSALR